MFNNCSCASESCGSMKFTLLNEGLSLSLSLSLSLPISLIQSFTHLLSLLHNYRSNVISGVCTGLPGGQSPGTSAETRRGSDPSLPLGGAREWPCRFMQSWWWCNHYVRLWCHSIIYVQVHVLLTMYTCTFNVYSGIIRQRWRPLTSDMSCDIELALQANHIQVNNEQRLSVSLTEEMVQIIKQLKMSFKYRTARNIGRFKKNNNIFCQFITRITMHVHIWKQERFQWLRKQTTELPNFPAI